MTQFEYLNGRPGYQYGIFNTKSGGPKFNIYASTPEKAMAQLEAKIGDTGLGKYEPRAIKPTRRGNTWSQTVVLTETDLPDVLQVNFPSIYVKVKIDKTDMTAVAELHHADGTLLQKEAISREAFRKYVFRTTSRRFVVNIVQPEKDDE